MFSYYGSKSKIAKYYPYPKYDTIIEPFAGAAWYSIFHKNKDIILNDKSKVIYDIWYWLINIADSKTLMGFRDLYKGENIIDLPISDSHRKFLGFCINRGSSSPCNIVQKWSCQSNKNPDYASTVRYQIDRAISLLEDVYFWEIYNKDYKELPDMECTWFIDPPYMQGGSIYMENEIDYKELSEFCLSRKGQVIVCENEGADWLDFKPLLDSRGQRSSKKEFMFYRD